MKQAKKLFEMFIIAGIYIVLSAILYACQQQNSTSVTIPRAEVERLIMKSVDLFNTGDLRTVHGVYAPDFIRHEQEYADPRIGVGLFKDHVKQLREHFSEFSLTVYDLIIENDTAVLHWIVKLKPKPTEEDSLPMKPHTVRGVTISRIENGQIAEQWVYYDSYSIVKQLGYGQLKTEQSAQ